ncbi:hypothetical protein AgCh_034829 [Apium graveolens]
MNGVGRWSEGGDSTRSHGSGGNNSEEVARFKEIEGVVRENHRDNFAVVVTPKNQESVDKEGNILNLSEKAGSINTILDTKRRRTEMSHTQLDYGPSLMQTDGLLYEEGSKEMEVSDPKNLYGAGPGIQARRGL